MQQERQDGIAERGEMVLGIFVDKDDDLFRGPLAEHIEASRTQA
jgi:hypothetical protein